MKPLRPNQSNSSRASIAGHGIASARTVARNTPLLLAAILAAFAAIGSAAPVEPVSGPLPEGSKRVFDFRVVGCPGGKLHGLKTVDGGRILVNRDANGARVRIERSAPDWAVSDGDATSNHPARLVASKPGIYDVYVKVLGDLDECPCANTRTDTISGETLCLVGTVDLSGRRGQSTLELSPAAMFDASLQERTWSMDINADLRIAQFRIYSRG
jgi:hypothetical protein